MADDAGDESGIKLGRFAGTWIDPSYGIKPPPPAFILGAGPYWHLPHINGYIGVPPGKTPNLWRRFWHWFFLGWTWKDTTMDELTNQ